MEMEVIEQYMLTGSSVEINDAEGNPIKRW